MLLAPSTVASQNLDPSGGTLRVVGAPIMTGGALTGCQITFDAMIRDYTYRQGAFIGVSGGVAIMNTQHKLGATVKVVVIGLDQAGEAAPSRPSRAYLISASYATNLGSLVTSTASDQPGGLFAVYQIEPTIKIVADSLSARRLVFAFNQNGGDTDIQLPVELDVASTDKNGSQVRNLDAINAFTKCLGALVKE